MPDSNLETRDFTSDSDACECPVCGRRGRLASIGRAWRWRHSKKGRTSTRAGLPMFMMKSADECWVSRRRSGALVSTFLKVVNQRSREARLTLPWGRSERIEPEGGQVNVWVPHRCWPLLKNKTPRGIRVDGREVELIHFVGATSPEESSGPGWKVRFALDLVGR